MDSPCVTCSAPTGDGAALCRDCTAKVGADLAYLSDLFGDLEVTMVRADVITDDRPAPVITISPAGPAELDPRGKPWAESLRPTALPFHAGAAELVHAVPATLGSWCRLLAEELHPDAPPGTDLPDPDVASMAAYLAARTPWWRMQTWSTDLQEELRALLEAVVTVVDRRAPQTFAGPCGARLRLTTDSAGESTGTCGQPLYGDQGAAYVVCRNCGTTWELSVLQAELIQAAQDQLAHVELLVGALSGLGMDLNVDRVRKWAQRGRLEQHGTDALGRKLYRVREAVELAADMAAGGRRAKGRRTA